MVVQRAMSHSMTRFPQLVYIIRPSGLLFTDWYEHLFERRLRLGHVSDRPVGPSRVARAGPPAGCSRLGDDRRRRGCSTCARPSTAPIPPLRRHPVVLARFAVLYVEACQAAVNRGLSEARGGLREVADGLVVEAAVETWQRESARLLGVRRAVGLVEEALRGRRFVARL